MDIKYIASAGYDFWSDTSTVISGTETIGYIWNGTEALDTGGDWIHGGYGTENSDSMRSGTNGLDATGMGNGDVITFTDIGGTNAAAYDALIIWTNVRSWETGKDIDIDLRELDGSYGTTLYLTSYIDEYDTNIWQKAVVLLEDFDLLGTNIDRLRLTSNGNIEFYLDDISFGISTIVYTPTPIEPYDIYGDEVGKVSMSGEETAVPGVPSPKAELVDLDLPEVSVDELVPDVGRRNIDLRPGLKATPSP